MSVVIYRVCVCVPPQNLVTEKSIVAFVVIAGSVAFFGLWMVLWRDPPDAKSRREKLFLKTGDVIPGSQLVTAQRFETAAMEAGILVCEPDELSSEALLSVSVSQQCCSCNVCHWLVYTFRQLKMGVKVAKSKIQSDNVSRSSVSSRGSGFFLRKSSAVVPAGPDVVKPMCVCDPPFALLFL